MDSTKAAVLTGFRDWRALAMLVLVLLALPSHAEWREASSDHFVIYADQDGADLERFAQRLERFHAAMALRYPAQNYRPSPSNRVTIYVVSNQKEVRKLGEHDDRMVAGFYRPRAGATVAVIPKLRRPSSKFELSPETILLHEYAHHFMYGLSARAYPRWLVEGFAEFFAAVRFESDGSVGLGLQALHRSAELVLGRNVPMQTLLEFDGGTASKDGRDSFYGQSWLLFHYLMFEPSRAQQLTKYQELLARGRPAVEAATEAFGDLDRLGKDLERYQNRRMLSYMTYPGSKIQVSPIDVRTLRSGEAEMMPVRMASRLGVSREQALALLPEARQVAARHPDDAAVQATLAEVECDAGHDEAAIAAAERALAVDPAQVDARIQKGLAMYRRAESSNADTGAWQEVRGEFVRANKLENDHPIPLIQYYLSYLAEGVKPPKVAIEGLEWAMVLAPFDPNLRWIVVQQMIADGRLADAARTLGPLAYNPHPGEGTEHALELLQEIEGRLSGGEGQPAH